MKPYLMMPFSIAKNGGVIIDTNATSKDISAATLRARTVVSFLHYNGMLDAVTVDDTPEDKTTLQKVIYVPKRMPAGLWVNGVQVRSAEDYIHAILAGCDTRSIVDSCLTVSDETRPSVGLGGLVVSADKTIGWKGQPAMVVLHSHYALDEAFGEGMAANMRWLDDRTEVKQLLSEQWGVQYA